MGLPPLIGTHRLAPRQPQPINLRKRKEAAPVHEEIVLPESRLGAHGSGRVGHDLQHMIPPVDDRAARVGVVDLLTVREEEALAGRDAPDHGDVVFLAAAGRAGLPLATHAKDCSSRPPPMPRSGEVRANAVSSGLSYAKRKENRKVN